ncbi:MAG: hypothetical protein ACD_79C00066G0002 [uncultured bacterium]|nr:MAG: hypothetical protein ACD_79C00066G0002 [uncultured bacterium]
MKEKHMKNLSTDWARLSKMRDADIDTSDIPPLDETFFKNVIIQMPEKKEIITIRLDKPVINWFRSKGKGYQTKINAILKTYIKSHAV